MPFLMNEDGGTLTLGNGAFTATYNDEKLEIVNGDETLMLELYRTVSPIHSDIYIIEYAFLCGHGDELKELCKQTDLSVALGELAENNDIKID